MSEELKMILRNSRLSITKPRLLILNSFLHEAGPLDLQYFLQQHPRKFERTTLFRTLKLFMNKKIIYSVYADGVNKYFLCETGKTETKNVHSTFVCARCGKTIRLENISLPKLKIPNGFKEENLEVIIHGDCNGCKN